MNRLLLALVVLLGAAGLLVVVLSERRPPRGDAPPAAVAPAEPEPPPPAPARPLPAPAEAARAAGDEAAPPPAAPAPAGAPPWDPTERVRALEPMRRQLLAGLDELRWRVDRCDLSGVTLFLALETLPGGVRIVDARVERPAEAHEAAPQEGGGARAADEEVGRCVREGLSGNVVSARDAVAGRSWEMPWMPGEQP